MAAPDSPIAEPSGLLLLPPLLMALGIIFAVFLTLLALHFLLKRLHARNPPAAASTQQTSNCACLGVDSKVPVDSLPVHAYSKDLHKFLLQHECCVCLSALEDGALVRILPACRHVFHRQCVDAWFASHSSCPFCRAEVVAAATESPFVVPIDAGPARMVGLP